MHFYCDPKNYRLLAEAYGLTVIENMIKGDSKMEKKNHIIRTYSAGVFFGEIEKRSEDGKRVWIKDAIRLWQWSGACSLSQLAAEGTVDSDGCKFAVPVSSIEVTEAIEILETTEKADQSIRGVSPWIK